MKKNGIAAKSVICMALFFVLWGEPALPFPFLKTIYMIPQDEFDFSLNEQFHSAGRGFRVERVSIGFAVLSGFSLWFSSSYLHGGGFSGSDHEIGDSGIMLKFSAGDYFRDSVHVSFLSDFRIPTGKDAYTVPGWGDVSFGNNEIKTGPVIQFDAGSSFFFHLNLFYVFTQGEGEDFYEGFGIKFSDKSSYKKVLGFNPMDEKAFFYHDKLKDDYIDISAGINTDLLYPLVPFLSFHFTASFNGELPSHIPCGGGMSFSAAGIRFFFNKSSFAGIYGAINPVIKEKVNYIAGVDAAILF